MQSLQYNGMDSSFQNISNSSCYTGALSSLKGARGGGLQALHTVGREKETGVLTSSVYSTLQTVLLTAGFVVKLIKGILETDQLNSVMER